MHRASMIWDLEKFTLGRRLSRASRTIASATHVVLYMYIERKIKKDRQIDTEQTDRYRINRDDHTHSKKA